ncbi:AfsR/SARP family transcriptional regulator [Nonomuraea guangzhouensis]|uniref:BTAD domain-containing putative transcriptional regulator n=1 Tax=Nonomuraea guangzhouensis TaxID=1291555 RepID=A0ABW4GBT1_9ACTN|nr:BTAD domain-containing putative transcriptional regulator [Nonomuraea guangzhouensis]
MRISILGTLEVATADAEPVAVGGFRVRALLAVLALAAGRTVTSERLIDALWPDEPPVNAANALQTLVRRLRVALRPYEIVRSRPGGYLLAIDPDQVDALRFRHLTRAATSPLDARPAQDPSPTWQARPTWETPETQDTRPAQTPGSSRDERSPREAGSSWEASVAWAAADSPRETGSSQEARTSGTVMLDEALALWRGAALADLGAVPYLANVAAGLEEDRLAAVEARAEARLAAGEPADLGAEVSAHPLRERLCALEMRGLAAAGRQADALALFERTRGTLADELGVDPGPELRAAHLAVVSGDVPVRQPAPRRRDLPKGNIRVPLTTFIGREDELDLLTAVLGHARMVTIVGPGGAGKTRLAGETALRMGARFDGTWMVELAPVTDPAAVPGALLDALGLRDDRPGYSRKEPDLPTMPGTPHRGPDVAGRQERAAAGGQGPEVAGGHGRDVAGGQGPEAAGGQGWDVAGGPGAGMAGYPRQGPDTQAGWPVAGGPLQQVVEALGERRVLIVLDNCEHLVDAAARLADDLLTGCPGVHVLATSREPLGVPGERLAPIPPLEPPPTGVGAARAAEYPSVRLLLDRATAARPAFALDEENVAAVVALCRRLDGMPLAIELAAARLRTMTPRQLADRIDDRFRLLTGGSRTALPRQQTLRAVVEWSWDLLDEPERELARRFAIFAGGATLESVEAVCGGTADVLGALADKSLVQVSPEGRYSMLETIRAYAADRLAEAGEADTYRRRHVVHLLDLAERAVPELRTGAQIEWIERLSAERDDYSVALRWALDRRDVELALRLCAALNWYWWMCGYRRDGATWARQVLDLAGDTPPEGLVRAYTACLFADGVDRFAEIVGDRPAMETLSTYMDELIEAAEREGPTHPLLLISRAVMAGAGGRDEHAAALLDRYAASDDLWLASSAKMIGGPHRSEEALEQAVAGFRKLGDRWGLSEALLGLAALRAERGERSDALIAETVSLTSEWVSPEETISTLTRLATLRAQSGDLDGAAADLAKARLDATTGPARARIGAGEEISAFTLIQLGLGEAALAYRLGDIEESLAAYRGLFELLPEAPAIPQLAVAVRTGYGRALAVGGDPETGLEQHRLALGLLGPTPDLPYLSVVLAGCALAELAGGAPERAAVLFGASAAVEPPDIAADTVAGTVSARTALGDSRYDDLYGKGAAMTRQEVYEMIGSIT